MKQGAAAGPAKQRFLEQAQSLGETGLEAYGDVQQEAALKRQMAEAENVRFLEQLQALSSGGGFQPPKSRFYRPYRSA
jgi:hypothetical protein